MQFQLAAHELQAPCWMSTAILSADAFSGNLHTYSDTAELDRFKDKEVQRDAKMVSYKVVDKASKPYVEVEVGGEKKVSKLSTMLAGTFGQQLEENIAMFCLLHTLESTKQQAGCAAQPTLRHRHSHRRRSAP